jgi:hypothetical protein
MYHVSLSLTHLAALQVCNHPDLFEPRPIVSPYAMTALACAMPAVIMSVMQPPPLATLTTRLLRPLWPVTEGGAFACHSEDEEDVGGRG